MKSSKNHSSSVSLMDFSMIRGWFGKHAYSSSFPPFRPRGIVPTRQELGLK